MHPPPTQPPPPHPQVIRFVYGRPMNAMEVEAAASTKVQNHKLDKGVARDAKVRRGRGGGGDAGGGGGRRGGGEKGAGRRAGAEEGKGARRGAQGGGQHGLARRLRRRSKGSSESMAQIRQQQARGHRVHVAGHERSMLEDVACWACRSASTRPCARR